MNYFLILPFIINSAIVCKFLNRNRNQHLTCSSDNDHDKSEPLQNKNDIQVQKMICFRTHKPILHSCANNTYYKRSIAIIFQDYSVLYNKAVRPDYVRG